MHAQCRVLGNTITGISVGLGTIIEELSSGADKVEKLLAMGATRWEATRAPVARAVKLAMTPLLNQVGLEGAGEGFRRGSKRRDGWDWCWRW